MTDTTLADAVSAPAGSQAAGIDPVRYPVDRLDGEDGRRLVARCRAQLDDDGCVVLPGFLDAATRAQMARETEALAGDAFYNDTRTNPWSGPCDPALPADHPQNRFADRRNAFVAADRIGPATAIRRLYHDADFKAFLARVLGMPVLHEYGDPLAHLVVNVLPPGAQHPWHYDSNAFIVTMVTRKAEAGGVFEYAPRLRSDADENIDGVRRVLDGDRAAVKALDPEAGSLQIFFGRHSLHRVTRVRGGRDRHSVIFAYAAEPGLMSSPGRTRTLFGRIAPAHAAMAETGNGDDAPARSGG